MIAIGRWVYDPTRGLALDCRNPAASDEVLRKYTVSSSTASFSTARKRAKTQQSDEDIEEVSDDDRFGYYYK